MRAWSERLAAFGVVETFDYPYMQSKRRAPDPQAVLIRAHLDAIAEAQRKHPEHELILIGKSMGSRMGCHVALEYPVSRVICLGYPLVSPGDASKVRDKVLLELETPILFVQGTRDPLCPLELLAKVRAKMKARTKLFVVDAGDHSLQVTKTQLKTAGETQEKVDERVLHVIRHFVEGDSLAPPSSQTPE